MQVKQPALFCTHPISLIKKQPFLHQMSGYPVKLTHCIGFAAPGSFLANFTNSTKDMTPADRGQFLENPPDGAPDIEDAHKVLYKEVDVVHSRIPWILSSIGSSTTCSACEKHHSIDLCLCCLSAFVKIVIDDNTRMRLLLVIQHLQISMSLLTCTLFALWRKMVSENVHCRLC